MGQLAPLISTLSVLTCTWYIYLSLRDPLLSPSSDNEHYHRPQHFRSQHHPELNHWIQQLAAATKDKCMSMNFPVRTEHPIADTLKWWISCCPDCLPLNKDVVRWPRSCLLGWEGGLQIGLARVGTRLGELKGLKMRTTWRVQVHIHCLHKAAKTLSWPGGGVKLDLLIRVCGRCQDRRLYERGRKR